MAAIRREIKDVERQYEEAEREYAKVSKELASVTQQRLNTEEELMGSNVRLKLANMRDKLLLRAEPTQMLILSAETARPGEGIAAVTRFREATGPLGPWMDRVSAIE